MFSLQVPNLNKHFDILRQISLKSIITLDQIHFLYKTKTVEIQQQRKKNKSDSLNENKFKSYQTSVSCIANKIYTDTAFAVCELSRVIKNATINLIHPNKVLKNVINLKIINIPSAIEFR